MNGLNFLNYYPKGNLKEGKTSQTEYKKMVQLTESDQSSWPKNEKGPNLIPADKIINLTWLILLQEWFKAPKLWTNEKYWGS